MMKHENFVAIRPAMHSISKCLMDVGYTSTIPSPPPRGNWRLEVWKHKSSEDFAFVACKDAGSGFEVLFKTGVTKAYIAETFGMAIGAAWGAQ